jgi:predicted regulator of Ras-like GTPase activity (Roadblock/LC7/MglB family)
MTDPIHDTSVHGSAQGVQISARLDGTTSQASSPACLALDITVDAGLHVYGSRGSGKDDHLTSSDFVLYEEEFQRLEEALRRLRQEANGRAVFLIDKNGQQLAAAGEVEQFDTTSLASLTAGNVAATDGLAKLIGEREFSVLFHEGQQDHIHISIVAKRAILVVIFDERSSLGLVRLRVKRASGDLEKIFETMLQKGEASGSQTGSSPFSEITDDDIDALFSE